MDTLRDRYVVRTAGHWTIGQFIATASEQHRFAAVGECRLIPRRAFLLLDQHSYESTVDRCAGCAGGHRMDRAVTSPIAAKNWWEMQVGLIKSFNGH